MYYRPRGKYAINRKRLRLSQSWKTLGRDDRNELVNLLKVLGITIAVIAALYFVGIKGLTYIGGVLRFFLCRKSTPPRRGKSAPPPTPPRHRSRQQHQPKTGRADRDP